MPDFRNSLGTESSLEVGGKRFRYFAVNGGELAAHAGAARLPVSSKILLENLLRHEDGVNCTRDDIEALAASAGRGSEHGPVRCRHTRRRCHW